MFIKDFNQNNQERIASLQKTLKEEFGVAFVQKFPTEDKLKLLKDSANQKIEPKGTAAAYFRKAKHLFTHTCCTGCFQFCGDETLDGLVAL